MNVNTFKEYHDKITDCFYHKKNFKGKILTAGEFEKLHSINHLELAKYQRANGLTPQTELPNTDIDALIANHEKIAPALVYDLNDGQ